MEGGELLWVGMAVPDQGTVLVLCMVHLSSCLHLGLQHSVGLLQKRRPNPFPPQPCPALLLGAVLQQDGSDPPWFIAPHTLLTPQDGAEQRCAGSPHLGTQQQPGAAEQPKLTTGSSDWDGEMGRSPPTHPMLFLPALCSAVEQSFCSGTL